jgi:hypothetical protein
VGIAQQVLTLFEIKPLKDELRLTHQSLVLLRTPAGQSHSTKKRNHGQDHQHFNQGKGACSG